jgi:hypothetical protein
MVVESVMMTQDAQDQYETQIDEHDLRDFGANEGHDDQR